MIYFAQDAGGSRIQGVHTKNTVAEVRWRRKRRKRSKNANFS